MINWIDKPGLHDAVIAAGYALRIRENHAGVTEVTTNDDVAVEAFISAYTVEQSRNYLKLQIGLEVTRMYDAGVESSYGYTPSHHETNGWLKKEEEALAYQAWVDAGSNGQAPNTAKINPRVTASNPLATEVAAILTNAAALHGLEDAINVWAQGKKDLVNAAVTFDELNAIDVRSGAPL